MKFYSHHAQKSDAHGPVTVSGTVPANMIKDPQNNCPILVLDDRGGGD